MLEDSIYFNVEGEGTLCNIPSTDDVPLYYPKVSAVDWVLLYLARSSSLVFSVDGPTAESARKNGGRRRGSGHRYHPQVK